MSIGQSTQLQASGAISFSQINQELDRESSSPISLGEGNVRELTSRTGSNSMGNCHGKKWAQVASSTTDAYNKKSASPHRPIEHIDKGEMDTTNGVLKTSDNKYLGRFMNIFFNTYAYANEAHSYDKGNFKKSNGRRMSDNKIWTYDDHDRDENESGSWFSNAMGTWSNCIAVSGCYGGACYYTSRRRRYRRDRWK